MKIRTPFARIFCFRFNLFSLANCMYVCSDKSTVAASITQKPSSIVAEVGENVIFPCQATGLPLPTITWRRAFGSLPKGKAAVVDGNLTIRNITKTARVITCVQQRIFLDRTLLLLN